MSSRLINDWSNDTNLLFLRVYFNEPVLWDPRHRSHKEKACLNEAWERISHLLGTNIMELKKKRESLMATFRSHVRKKKATIHAGATGGDIYQPSWFAYELMESYLGPVYDCNLTAANAPSNNATGTNDNGSENSLEGQAKLETEEDASLPAEDAQPANDSHSPTVRISVKRRRKAAEMTDAALPGAHEHYSNAARTPYSPLPSGPIMPNIPLAHDPHHYVDDDECDLFSRLLAKKLRKLPETEREVFMYQIDGMFINRMRQMNRPPSPSFSYAVPSPTVQHDVD